MAQVPKASNKKLEKCIPAFEPLKEMGLNFEKIFETTIARRKYYNIYKITLMETKAYILEVYDKSTGTYIYRIYPRFEDAAAAIADF
jgi:hypothetical protein